MKKHEKGFRVSLWFPDRDSWIQHAINKKLREYEDAGIPYSRAELLRTIIKSTLSEPQDQSDIPPQ